LKNEFSHNSLRPFDVQLLNQKSKLFLQVFTNGPEALFKQSPELLLKRANRLLPGLVDELSFGVDGLSLGSSIDLEPFIHFLPEALRHRLMLHYHILDGRG